MPTTGCIKFWEADARRWERCRRDAAATMVSEGWSPHANKFTTVMLRRALKLWRTD